MGSNWWYSGFSLDQNNRDSSDAYVYYMYRGETPHGTRRSWTHSAKTPNTPNWSSVADDTIARGGISFVYQNRKYHSMQSWSLGDEPDA